MREKGDVLEDHVYDTWPNPISRESNSGARDRQNDLVDKHFSIECKRKTKQESVTLSGKEIKTTIRKARRRNRLPLWVIESALGTFVIAQYNDFCELVHEEDE